MTRIKVPPYEVNILLQFRFSTQCRPCCFSRARPANYQLDVELFRPVGHPHDIQDPDDLHDAIGYDEPYWECLLEEGRTYKVAYRKRPFGFGVLRLHDALFRIPVFAPAVIPPPDQRNSTACRKAQLLVRGLISANEVREYRRTLSDGADRMFATWTSIPKGAPERIQRVVQAVSNQFNFEIRPTCNPDAILVPYP